MALAVTHNYTNPIADDAADSAAGKITPTRWNAAHTIAGLGTGVETALGVNVGSAGALVVNGGALGTPSSGTLTNCTGLPAAGVVGTAAVLGANTFTALQTHTIASANTGVIASTGYSLTGSNATSMIDLAGTWNTSGNPVALKIAMTNTASGSTSKFLSFLAGASGSTEVFAVDKAGNMTLAGPVITGSPGYIDLNFSTKSVRFSSASSSVLPNGGALSLGLDQNNLWTDVVATQHTQIGANAQKTTLLHLSEVTTIAASAFTDTTIQIPANALVLGVSVRVTAAVTCTSTFTVGDSGSAARFSTAAVSKALASTDQGTKAGCYYNATATSVRITPDTTPSDNTGRVRVTIHYIAITPPTS